MTAPHPSVLALDLAALKGPDATLQRHLETCASCRAHVTAASPSTEPVPTWAQTAAGSRWRLRLPWLSAAAAVVASLVFFVTLRQPEETTRSKGHPSFALYIERGHKVHLWDGRSPVHTDDRLQLKVAAAGFSYLVVGLDTPQGWRSVYEGEVDPNAATPLPNSWRVDEKDPVVHLGFLLCHGACKPAELEAAAVERPRTSQRWWSDFSLQRSDP